MLLPVWPRGGGDHVEAARLFGAAHTIRQRTGVVRFRVYDAEYSGIGGSDP